MPIYNYECKKCGNKKEILWTSIPKKDIIVLCNKCNKNMIKTISNTTFVLKGGGWYSDGYQKKV